jgi:hypothetical protein
MLAASELGPYIPGIGQAYHTSVLIDNEESRTPGDQNLGKDGKIKLIIYNLGKRLHNYGK